MWEFPYYGLCRNSGVIYARLIGRNLHRRGQERLLGEGGALPYAGNEAMLAIELLRLIYTSTWLQRRKMRTIRGKDIPVWCERVYVELLARIGYEDQMAVASCMWFTGSCEEVLIYMRMQKWRRPRLPASWSKVCTTFCGQDYERSNGNNLSD